MAPDCLQTFSVLSDGQVSDARSEVEEGFNDM
jgi:hypothetical protein